MILVRLVDLYSLVVLASVILSWIPEARNNPIGQLVERLTEPVLSKIRAVVPPLGGFDFSALILLLSLHFLERALIRL